MMATPAVAWGTKIDNRPDPWLDANRATLLVMSRTPGRFPECTTISSLIIALQPKTAVGRRLRHLAGELDHHVAVAKTEQEVGEDLTGIGLGVGEHALIERGLDENLFSHLAGVGLESRVTLGE